MPRPAQVRSALAYVAQHLGLDDAELAKSITAFPELVACSVEEQLQVCGGGGMRGGRMDGGAGVMQYGGAAAGVCGGGMRGGRMDGGAGVVVWRSSCRGGMRGGRMDGGAGVV